MTEEGPVLQILLQRLAETPADFLDEPRVNGNGKVHVDAVVSDVLWELGGMLLLEKDASFFQKKDACPDEQGARNLFKIILICSWLFSHPWFASRKAFANSVLAFLKGGLLSLSRIVRAEAFVSDADRREELARACLNALGLRPAGESIAQAQDRLQTLDSVETQKVVEESRKNQKRTQKILEAMRKKQAEEAASMYGRE